jgi:hypothetical protein
LVWEKLRTDLSSFLDRIRRKDDEDVALVGRAPQRGRGTRPRSGVYFSFRDTGECRFGNRCRFKHDIPTTSQSGNGEGHRVFVALADEASPVNVQSEYCGFVHDSEKVRWVVDSGATRHM